MPILMRQSLEVSLLNRECSHDLTGCVEELSMKLELKFDPIRQFYLRFDQSELNERELPVVLTNVVKRKDKIECLTLDLAKRNQKVGLALHGYCLETDTFRSLTRTTNACFSVSWFLE